MKKLSYYVDTVVLSFYAGVRSSGALSENARTVFRLARQRGRLVGSTLLELEAAKGNTEAAAKRRTALRLVQIFQETSKMRNLAAQYAEVFNRPEDDEDLRHYAAASLKGVDYFISEDKFFKDRLTVVDLVEFNKQAGIPVPTIVSCDLALHVLSRPIRTNPSMGGGCIAPTPFRLNKAEKAIYAEAMLARRQYRKAHRAGLID